MDTPNHTDKGIRNLLPSLVRHPLTLLIAVAVPQIVLLWVNLRAYHLISGEVDEKQSQGALLFFGGEIALLAIGLVLSVVFLLRKTQVPWAFYWVILISYVVYLVIFCFQVHELIPDSMSVWIVPPASLISAQFVGLMPATFLAALALACFPTKLSLGADIGISSATAIGTPVIWYMITQIGHKVLVDFPEKLIAMLFILSSLICMAGLIRLLVMAYNGLRRWGPVGQAILLFIVAVAGPIGGLLLNRSIPFPSNFQSPYIYALAIGNGIALMIPVLKNQKANSIIWFIQCLFFPFSLYFFVAFLPWLPLSILAIIAVGSGFLIMVPTLLFIVHLKKIGEGINSKSKIIIAVAAFLVWPAYLYLECILDRKVLHQSIDYIYSPDFEKGDRFVGNRSIAKRSMHRLNHIKHGMYLPFLTEIYNDIVLDNLVLSDSKLQHIHLSFFGEPLPALKFEGGILENNRSNRGQRNARLATPPPTGVNLEKLTHQHNINDGFVRTLVRFEMKNPLRNQAEFTTKIQVPDGTFVSGYWLDVEGERVPGQIFEKKTAMWVYRMIRDATRRDPGLLVYETPNQLELRVFPFAAKQTRITEIEFLTPVGISNPIQIGGQTIEPPENPPILSPVASPGSNGEETRFVLNTASQETIPSLKRTPYLHLIIDRSLNAPDLEEIAKQSKLVFQSHPEIKTCRITLANFEFVDLVNGESISIEQFRSVLFKGAEKLPKRGQLLTQRALKRNLFRLKHQQDETFPLYAFIGNKHPRPVPSETLDWFRDILPDFNGYYFKSTEDEKLQSYRFNGKASDEIVQRPIHLLKSNQTVVAIPANTGQTQTISVPGRERQLAAYDEDSKAYLDLAIETLNEKSPYATANAGWAINRRAYHNPVLINSLLPEIVSQSRDSGILLPATAFIVVENSAQWKILKRKEKQKLKGNQALDHMETPEPGWWLILCLYLVILFINRMRKTSKMRRC